MPGNDRDGGFATHVTVPARGLAAVTRLPAGHDLADLSVVADAVSTPLQALKRASVGPGDFVVVVGAGGVGTHAVQVAAAWGATVVALDVDAARLEALSGRERVHLRNVKGQDARTARELVRQVAKEAGAPRDGWKIFECSGTVAGQETAFGLLGPAATLGVIGFTRQPVSLRLSNLMAFDAEAFGSWGCLPELYPEAIDLVADGKVALRPFLRRLPLSALPAALASAHAPSDPRRVVLVPELG
jgi:6-hydroxycyclohex-1-ene-1-carbonyl-CoA dehydrogenase